MAVAGFETATFSAEAAEGAATVGDGGDETAGVVVGVGAEVTVGVELLGKVGAAESGAAAGEAG